MLQFGESVITFLELLSLVLLTYIAFILVKLFVRISFLALDIALKTMQMILITKRVMKEASLKGNAIKIVIKNWKFKTMIVRALSGTIYYSFNPKPTAKRIHKTLKKLVDAELNTHNDSKVMYEDRLKHLMNEIKADLDKRKAERDDKLAQTHVRTIVISSKQGLAYVLDCVNKYLLDRDLSRLNHSLQYCIGFSKQSAGEIAISNNIDDTNAIVLITSDSGEPQSIIIMLDPEFDITPLVDADHPYWAKIKDNIPEDKPEANSADDSISDGSRV